MAFFKVADLGVSKNRGTPKSSIAIEFSIINHPFWGTPIFGNTHLSPKTCSETGCHRWRLAGSKCWLPGFGGLIQGQNLQPCMFGFFFWGGGWKSIRVFFAKKNREQLLREEIMKARPKKFCLPSIIQWSLKLSILKGLNPKQQIYGNFAWFAPKNTALLGLIIQLTLVNQLELNRISQLNSTNVLTDFPYKPMSVEVDRVLPSIRSFHVS